MIKRTNVNLDIELVRAAAGVLGTRQTTETVHAAMREVVAQARRRSLAERDLPDLTAEAVETMRRSRH